MELRTYCAYNQTRECFLGLEVTAGDFSYDSLSREEALKIKPSGGLWLRPFRGIPESGATTPVDLIFLDKECRVVGLVESFPAERPNSSIPAADTLLVLPQHSILLSETRVDDEVLLCVREEMQQRLERRYTRREGPELDRHPDESIAKSIGRRVLQLVGVGQRTAVGDLRSTSSESVYAGSKAKEHLASEKKWLPDWLKRDLRKAPRKPVSGLEAYYWNGLPPQAHDIRDISAAGLYLVTDDRWYPGTLILMTLQDRDALDDAGGRAIAVNVRAVRWGNDGVGLQFVPTEDGKESPSDSYGKGTCRKELEEFLRRIDI